LISQSFDEGLQFIGGRIAASPIGQVFTALPRLKPIYIHLHSVAITALQPTLSGAASLQQRKRVTAIQ